MKKYILAVMLMTALTLTAVACDLIEVPGETTDGATITAATPDTAEENETTQETISEEQAMEMASNYWNIQTGDMDPNTGYRFRIEAQGKTQTPANETVYVIALRWLVEDSHYSTVDTVWVDVMTGVVMIPYENPADTSYETPQPEQTESAEETTAPVTEIETVPPKEPDSDVETTAPETESAAETQTDAVDEVDPSEPRLIQFPLTGADDTTSYVSLPDLTAEEGRFLRFLILPSDTEDPALTEALKIPVPLDAENNILVMACRHREQNSLSIIMLRESTRLTTVEGLEYRYVSMEGTSVSFFPDKAGMGLPRYYHMDGGGSAYFQYTDKHRQSMLANQRMNNITMLSRIEDLLYPYRDSSAYEFTVLYSYMNGEEIVNTPVEAMPEFPFELFNEYGFDN